MKKKPIERLPDGELEVMQALWDCKAPAARTDVEAVLPRKLAPTTLLTVLTRLEEKQFLSSEKEGRRCRYTPLVTREAYLAAQSSSFFHKLCKGSVRTFAAALCDSDLSQKDLEELRELLDEGNL